MKRLLPAIVFFAFALRLGYAFASGALWHPQEWEDERIAVNLAERHAFFFRDNAGLEYRSYAEPMYPMLCAAVYMLTDHNQTVLVLVQLLIAAGTVWMTARATKLATGDDLTANAAAALLAVHPGFIRYSSILHPFVLDSFFFIAAAAALIRYRHEPALKRGLIAAALIGFGTLTRPTILVFLAPLCWIAWHSRERFTERAKQALLVGLALFACIAPWTIRNAVVHRAFVLTRSGTGLVFWLGHNPHASGGAVDTAGVPIIRTMPAEMRARIVAADELARDKIYADAAREYILADPIGAVRRIALRFYYFWWFSPQWGAVQTFSPKARLIYRAWWSFLLALTLIGLFASRRMEERRDLWLLAVLALLISLGQSLYYVEGRHRLAIEPLVIPLAAVGLTSLRPRASAATTASTSRP